MKRSLALLLVSTMLLALAAPAMAYTEKKEKPISLSIRLMEAETNALGGYNFTPVSGNRRYTKNEILCAAVSLFVPEGANPYEEGYSSLLISGKNAMLDVMENYTESGGELRLHTSENVPEDMLAAPYKRYRSISISLHTRRGAGGVPMPDATLFADDRDQTYEFMFFVKPTGENPAINAMLTGEGFLLDSANPNKSTMLIKDSYAITKDTAGLVMLDRLYVNKTVYTIEELDGFMNRFHIIANKDTDKIESLLLSYQYERGKYTQYRAAFVRGTLYFFVENPAQQKNLPPIVWAKGALDAQKLAYMQLISMYQSLVADTFGVDFTQTGHSLNDFFAEELMISRMNDIGAALRIPLK